VTTAISFAEHAVTIFFYLLLVAGVVAVLMYATGLTQQRQASPRHRAGDPPPDLADDSLHAMRDLEADGATRLRREMEECDD